MKRIAILLLALCLLLPACGRVKPEPVPETTAGIKGAANEEITTEEPSTETPITAREVSWRVIPTDAAMKKGIASWADEEMIEYNKKTELKLPGNKAVVINREEMQKKVVSQIILRNEIPGGETLLLEDTVPDYYGGSVPFLSCVLNERYFLITWLGMDSWAGCSVFDIQEKREIPIQFPENFVSRYFLTYANDGYLYFMMREEDRLLRITRIELSALLKDNHLQATEIFADTKVGYTNWHLISPDGRYLAAVEGEEADFLLVYDLAQQKCILRLQPPGGGPFNCPHFVDDHTLYFYDWYGDSLTHALEITLP